MKKIILGVLILILIIAGTPWVMGLYFKHYYFNFINQINQMQSQVTVNISEYEMGWLHSRAKVSITPILPKDLPPLFQVKQSIIDELSISHGPIVYDPMKNKCFLAIGLIKHQFHLPAWLESILLPGQTQGVIQGISLIKFDGDFYNQVNTPIFNISLPMIGKISWQGLKANSYLKVDNQVIKRVSFNIQIGALQMKEDANSILQSIANKNNANQNNSSPQPQLKEILTLPMTLRADLKQDSNGLWIGSSDLKVDQVLVKNNDKTVFGLDRLQFFWSDYIENKLYSAVEHFTINNISVPNFIFPSIGPLDITFAINQLNATALGDLINHFQQNANLDKEDVKKQFEMLLPQLISANSNFHQTGFIKTSFGPTIWNLNISLAKGKPLPKNLAEMDLNTSLIFDLSIASSLVDKIIEWDDSRHKLISSQNNTNSMNNPAPSDTESLHSSQGEANLPPTQPTIKSQVMMPNNSLKTNTAPLADLKPANKQAIIPEISARKKLDDWLAQGYIIKKGDNYYVSITREQGVLKINGKIPPGISPQSPESPKGITSPNSVN